MKSHAMWKLSSSKFVFSSFLGLLALLLLSSTVIAAPAVKGELLVQQALKANPAQFKDTLKAQGAEVLGEIPAIRVKRIRVPEKNIDKVKAALAKNPNFSFVEENFLGQGTAVPNDPSFASQWHHSKIMSPSAWDLGTGSTAIPIAIIDSGVDPDHPDLMGKLLPGYNFVSGNTDTHDVLGHGTAVAGSAGALSNNSVGVAGVAWNNPIMPLVVLNSSNSASYSNIASAITYAVNNGAKVINISIAGSSSSYTLQNAVNYAWDNGVLVFASAANNNTSARFYPAACTNAVAVAATDSADRKASFSNYGDWINLTAPGVSILTTSNGGGYGYWSGTSFSSPVTAGLAALIWSANPQLSHQQIVEILQSTTDDLGATGFDNTFGHGRINAYNAMMDALNYQAEVDTTAPAVVLTSPTDSTTVAGTVAITATATDDVAVSKVEFRVDGSLLAIDSSAPFSTNWNTDSAFSGSHIVEAKAFDAAGNVSPADSAQVFIEEIVEVVDEVPPTVTILSPSNGAALGNRATVKASAADENGISEMKVFVNGQLMRTEIASSLRWRWNTRKLSKGTYRIRVEAKDPAGNVGIDEITVYK